MHRILNVLVKQEEHQLEKERLKIECQDITSQKGQHQLNPVAKPFVPTTHANDKKEQTTEKPSQPQNIKDTSEEWIKVHSRNKSNIHTKKVTKSNINDINTNRCILLTDCTSSEEEENTESSTTNENNN